MVSAPRRATAAALLLGVLLFAGPVYSDLVAPAPTRVLVGFEHGALPTAQAGTSFAGLKVIARLPQIEFLVVVAPGLEAARTALLAVPGVRTIEVDPTASATATPDDARFDGQYGPVVMGFPRAWDSAGYGSAAVTVAIIDSGVQSNHPDLDSSRMRAGHDYVNNDNVPDDTCGHGTHVTGTVAARTNNHIGVAGMSQTTILPLKVLRGTSSGCMGYGSWIAQAILDATDQGAKVISMSLGGLPYDNANAAAVQYAWAHGVVIVAAAGNTGTTSMSYPALYPEVIAVSAVNSDLTLASYSSRGTKVEVAGPGTDIDSTYNDGGYRVLSGTSMATPHVAGAIALALGCAPAGTTNQQMRDALRATAQDLGGIGRDAYFGYGLVRADSLVAHFCAQPRLNHAPLAKFTVTGTGLIRTFDASLSNDPDADPLAFAWDFGDGTGASGVTVPHTFGTAGAFIVRLTASDGWLASSANQTVSATVPPFAATFTPSSSVNEWWVDVKVKSNAPTVAVSATVKGGAPQNLPATSWGTWAASFHVPQGSIVLFTAANAAGDQAVSPPISWLGPAPAPAPLPVPDPTFTATFAVPSSVNQWWVEAKVTSSHTVSGVNVSVDGAARVSLAKQSWGNWARSIAVQPGSAVVFTATDSNGTQVSSPIFYWLSSSPGGPFTATITPTQTSNHWWIEAKVSANQPVQSVEVQRNGGTWMALAKTSYGTWAKSLAAPSGTTVVFRAISGTGVVVTSQAFTWQ